MDPLYAHLHGSCACERNQYAIAVPRSSSSMAQVFFDNSAENRRSQAAPVTAWLRIPLDWFHSRTYALMPDETHASIRRTYYTPSSSTTILSSISSSNSSSSSKAISPLPPTRRQFCGYCGTHLTAWNEGRAPGSADLLDITLGSLASESLDALAELQILPEDEEEELESSDRGYSTSSRNLNATQTQGGEPGLVMGGSIDDEDHIPPPSASKTATVAASQPVAATEGLVKGGTIDDETHIPTNEESKSGVDAPDSIPSNILQARKSSAHDMRHRGIPYFEDMLTNSRLGRIRRQRGGYTSADGRMTHEWEIVEAGGDVIGGDEGGDVHNAVMADAPESSIASTTTTTTSKRQKVRH